MQMNEAATLNFQSVATENWSEQHLQTLNSVYSRFNKIISPNKSLFPSTGYGIKWNIPSQKESLFTCCIHALGTPPVTNLDIFDDHSKTVTS